MSRKKQSAEADSPDTPAGDSVAAKAESSPETEEKQITYIDVYDIELGERLRAKINEAAMEELLISIEDIGLINPITVTEKDGKYVLVAGLHRLTAFNNLFQTLGAAYQKIPAIIVDEDKAEDIEICENLFRSDLCVLEKAKHLHKYLSSSIKKKKGVTYALTSLSEQLGKSQRTLFDYRTIGEFLKVDKEIMLLGTELKNSTKQLEYLAKKPLDEQKAIIKKIKADPKLSVRQAYSLVKQEGSEDGDERASKSTAPVRISVLVRDELKALAADTDMEQKEFTEMLLVKAMEAFRAGKITI